MGYYLNRSILRPCGRGFVNLAHPLCPDLGYDFQSDLPAAGNALYGLGFGKDDSGFQLNPDTGTAASVSPRGLECSNPAASGRRMTSCGFNPNGLSSFTVSVLAIGRTGVTTRSTVWSTTASAADYWNMSANFTTASGVFGYCTNPGSEVYWYNSTAGLWATDRPTMWTLVYDSTGSTNADKIKVYLDGAPISLTYSGTMPASITSGGVSSVGGGNLTGKFSGWIGQIEGAWFYKRTLGPAEVRSLAHDPWQMFEESALGPYLMPAAAGGGFQAAWARGANSVISAGVRAA